MFEIGLAELFLYITFKFKSLQSAHGTYRSRHPFLHLVQPRFAALLTQHPFNPTPPFYDFLILVPSYPQRLYFHKLLDDLVRLRPFEDNIPSMDQHVVFSVKLELF